MTVRDHQGPRRGWLDVVEVERPTCSARRRAGKTDQMDAFLGQVVPVDATGRYDPGGHQALRCAGGSAGEMAGRPVKAVTEKWISPACTIG